MSSGTEITADVNETVVIRDNSGDAIILAISDSIYPIDLLAKTRSVETENKEYKERSHEIKIN
jgi:hypothetical protein